MITPAQFARKLAFTTQPAGRTPVQATPSAVGTTIFPSPPRIGKRKTVAPVSPAAADAQVASAAMRPSTKTAMSPTRPVGVKKAPRHSKRGRKGKKVMPMPHAKMLKKKAGIGGVHGLLESLKQRPKPDATEKQAYVLFNRSCEEIGTIATDRVHDGMETATAIKGCLFPTTDLEKIAKFNYMQKQSELDRVREFGAKMATGLLQGPVRSRGQSRKVRRESEESEDMKQEAALA